MKWNPKKGLSLMKFTTEERTLMMRWWGEEVKAMGLGIKERPSRTINARYGYENINQSLCRGHKNAFIPCHFYLERKKPIDVYVQP